MDEDRQTLFRLDAQLTEILLSSEKKCSKRSINRDPWSPKLKEKGKTVVYWKQKLSILKHLNMPRTSLDSLQKAAGISTELHQLDQTIQQCAKHLHQAWTALKAARKEAELL